MYFTCHPPTYILSTNISCVLWGAASPTSWKALKSAPPPHVRVPFQIPSPPHQSAVKHSEFWLPNSFCLVPFPLLSPTYCYPCDNTSLRRSPVPTVSPCLPPDGQAGQTHLPTPGYCIPYSQPFLTPTHHLVWMHTCLSVSHSSLLCFKAPGKPTNSGAPNMLPHFKSLYLYFSFLPCETRPPPANQASPLRLILSSCQSG